jgi:hypothetical protein
VVCKLTYDGNGARRHFVVTSFSSEKLSPGTLHGALVAPEPLNLWSDLVLLVWSLPEIETTRSESGRTQYTRPEAICATAQAVVTVQHLSDDPRIRLVDASGGFTAIEAELLNTGYVEL